MRLLCCVDEANFLQTTPLPARNHPSRDLAVRQVHPELSRWCCQSNASRSPKSLNSGFSGRKLTPLGHSGRAVQLEGIAAVEMAVFVEVIVDRGVSGGELLQGLDVPESGHRALSSSKRLV